MTTPDTPEFDRYGWLKPTEASAEGGQSTRIIPARSDQPPTEAAAPAAPAVRGDIDRLCANIAALVRSEYPEVELRVLVDPTNGLESALLVVLREGAQWPKI